MALLVAEAVNPDANETVATLDASLDLVLHPRALSCFGPNQDDRDARAIEAVLDERLDSVRPCALGLLPKRHVDPAALYSVVNCSSLTDDGRAPDVPLVVEAEVDPSTRHRQPDVLVAPPRKWPARQQSVGAAASGVTPG